MRKIAPFAAVLAALLSPAALAQSSAGYRMEEHVLNSGGAPSEGLSVASASYELSMVSIGDGIAGPGTLVGSTYSAAVGFAAAYRAPGEVAGLMFGDDQTLFWIAEHSAGTYNLYRDTVSSLTGLGYGNCEQQAIATTTTTDSNTPAAGAAFFYLVTVKNRLHEEGIKGFDSSGAPRSGDVCP